MKRNEAIDNAFKAGFELVNGSIHVDGEDVTDEIVLLANIIEQATLGRAAKKFRENAELCADWMVRTKSMYLDGADVLDALKDSHE